MVDDHPKNEVQRIPRIKNFESENRKKGYLRPRPKYDLNFKADKFDGIFETRFTSNSMPI